MTGSIADVSTATVLFDICHELMRRGDVEQGMRLLRESAVERVLTGLTTLREINKVTFVE